MYDMMRIFLVVLGFLLAFPALWLVFRGFLGGTVELARRRSVGNPYRSLLIGAVLAALTFGLVSVANTIGGVAGEIAAFTIVCVYLAWAHLGLAGLVTHIGLNLPLDSDTHSPWHTTLRGGVALELTYLLPIVGWFGILPLSLIIGAGAATLAVTDRIGLWLRSEPVLAPRPALM